MTYNNLTKNTKKMLNHLMDKNCHFLVGDCNSGVDNNVLGYLAKPEGHKPYSDVTVYAQDGELKNKKLSSIKDLNQVIDSYHDRGSSTKYKTTRDNELKRLGVYNASSKNIDKDNDGPDW